MYDCMLALYHASDIDDEYHVRAAWEGFISSGKTSDDGS
jgi:nuclear pore complex protein Nup155